MLKPLKIRALMVERLREIEVEYRKRFGEELLREIGDLSGEMREI